MNILLLSPFHFSENYEKSTGGEQRSALIYTALRRYGNVYVIMPFPSSGEECNSPRIQYYKPCRPRNLIKRILTWFGFAIWRHTDFSLMPAKLIPDVSDFFPGVKFDVVVVRYYRMLQWIKPWHIAKNCYIDIDDHPLSTFDTMLSVQKGYGLISKSIWRWILTVNLKMAGTHFKGSWISNPDDIHKVGHGKTEELLLNIPVNLAETHYSSQGKKTLVTIGSLKHPPNIEGINSFVENIWPIIYAKHPDFEYQIIGIGAEMQYITHWSEQKGVRYIGPVDDVREYYKSCIVAVVPIHSGGGTCIKTLEALANYRVCLTTPFGARGLLGGANCRKNGIFIYHDVNDFSDILDSLVNDDKYRHDLEADARRFINLYYSEDNFIASVGRLLSKKCYQ